MARADARRRGGILVVVLIVAVTVAAASAGVLMFTTHFTRRQAHSVMDSRAFYLAEAGLGEAYQAVTSGQPGQIGSMAQPVVSGDGVFWVDAERTADGQIRLQSTALAGLGRSSLSLLVERSEQPLGIFATEDIVIDQPVLIDGYDSELAPYEEQLALPSVTIPPDTFFHDNRAIMMLAIDMMFYEIDHVEGDEYFYTATVERTPELWTTFDARDYLDKQRAEGKDPAVVTTAIGGTLGTNGSVKLTSPGGVPMAIYGDVVPGPGGQVSVGPGVTVSGGTKARPETVSLEPVLDPGVDLLPGVVHSSGVPMVIAPSTVGYKSLRVVEDSDLIIRGPSTVVLGQFDLEAGAAMFVENLDGPVDLYVMDSANLALDSLVEVESLDPDRLTLRLIGNTKPVVLASTSQFHGMVYGPEAAISVEGPFEIFGALIGRRLELGADVRLHFDGGTGGTGSRLEIPRLVSWDLAEVPPEVRDRNMSPLEALALEPADLLTLNDATQSYSWTAQVRYTTSLHGGDCKHEGGIETYEGPFEAFLYEGVKSISRFSLTPPDVTFPGESWTVFARYDNAYGNETTWEGPVEDYPYTNVRLLHERRMTPPPSLAILGYEGSHYVRP